MPSAIDPTCLQFLMMADFTQRKRFPVKKSLTLLALATAASFAADIKFGVDALAGYDIVSIGDDLDKAGVKSQASFGFGLGPTVKYPINDAIALNGSIQFQYDIVGTEMDFMGSKSETSASYMRLGLQFAPSYQINEQISAKLGYEWDMPLGGTTTTESGDEEFESDIVWAPSKGSDKKEKEAEVLSTHNLVIGAGYALMPNLTLTLQGKIGFNGLMPEYEENATTGEEGDLKGAADADKNMKLHQIAIGVNYSFN